MPQFREAADLGAFGRREGTVSLTKPHTRERAYRSRQCGHAIGPPCSKWAVVPWFGFALAGQPAAGKEDDQGLAKSRPDYFARCLSRALSARRLRVLGSACQPGENGTQFKSTVEQGTSPASFVLNLAEHGRPGQTDRREGHRQGSSSCVTQWMPRTRSESANTGHSSTVATPCWASASTCSRTAPRTCWRKT